MCNINRLQESVNSVDSKVILRSKGAKHNCNPFISRETPDTLAKTDRRPGYNN
jgi:hypothetical protein